MPQRDLVAARLLRAGADPETVEALKADREHAQRLATLAASASARGAAPLPPGKGGSAPTPAAAPSAPAEVNKYRAIESFSSSEISFEKGATIFVVGDVAGHETVQGVVGGKAGAIPVKAIRKITPELLEEERKVREREIEQARVEEEENLRQEMEKMKLEKTGAGGSAPGQPKTAEQLAYEAELEKKFEEERRELLEEEQRLKDEAARIEAMLKALDEED